MKKSIKIIIVFIGVGIVALLILKLILSGKKDSLPSSTSAESQDILPALPDSARDQYVRVEDSKNIAATKKIFEGFVNESVSESTIQAGVKSIKLTDASGNLLDLTRIISFLAINIPESFLGLVDTKNFEIFYCPSKNKGKDFGIVLYARALKDRPLNAEDYQKITDQMRRWENTMLWDLQFLLFPDAHFSDEQLSQLLRFQEGETRFANIQLPNGARKSINYKQFGAPIVIASSLQCLNNAEGYFFDTEEK